MYDLEEYFDQVKSESVEKVQLRTEWQSGDMAPDSMPRRVASGVTIVGTEKHLLRAE